MNPKTARNVPNEVSREARRPLQCEVRLDPKDVSGPDALAEGARHVASDVAIGEAPRGRFERVHRAVELKKNTK